MTSQLLEIGLPGSGEYLFKVKVDTSIPTPTLTIMNPAAGSTSPASGSSTPAPTTWPPDIEVLLKRYESNGKTKAWPHREIATKLLSAGFEPHPPKTGARPYIRWEVEGTQRKATVYQEGSGLLVDSHKLLTFVLGLPGAVPPSGTHPKVKWHYATSKDGAVDAALAIRAHADE